MKRLKDIMTYVLSKGIFNKRNVKNEIKVAMLNKNLENYKSILFEGELLRKQKKNKEKTLKRLYNLI